MSRSEEVSKSGIPEVLGRGIFIRARARARARARVRLHPWRTWRLCEI